MRGKAENCLPWATTEMASSFPLAVVFRCRAQSLFYSRADNVLGAPRDAGEDGVGSLKNFQVKSLSNKAFPLQPLAYSGTSDSDQLPLK